MGLIAREMGMSKCGAFAHSDSKDHLRCAVLERANEHSDAIVLRPAFNRRVVALLEGCSHWQPKALLGACPFGTASYPFDDRPGPVRDAPESHPCDQTGTIERAAVIAAESGFEAIWTLELCLNNACRCGDGEGGFTFSVMNPANSSDAGPPLWVYLHGGGIGYCDETETHHTFPGWQDETAWDEQESYTDLFGKWSSHKTVNADEQVLDKTFARRFVVGYLILVVSPCAHEQYSGVGTPYSNNPNDGEAIGLQTTMAAIDFTSTRTSTHANIFIGRDRRL